jgi:hypothetical protein
MFARYTRDPKRRIVFYTLLVLVVYAYQVYRTGWPTLQDVIIFVGLTFMGPFLPSEIKELVPMPESISAIVGDIGLFAVIFLGALVFFAQFTLPLKHTRERFHAAWRLFLYLFGKHGPAIFINDGVIVRGERELEKTGPGVILLDTASAAVLRTPLKVTRSVGPGVAFLKRKETVWGLVDLHRQNQFFGPTQKDDNIKEGGIFAPKQDDDIESNEDYAARQERRWLTSALTRDGIEVVPNVYVLFRLERSPEPGEKKEEPDSWFNNVIEKYSRREEVRSGFGYNPEAVKLAISHTSINPQESYGSDQRHIPWYKLPAYLAVEVWREHLRKFKFDELFTFANLNPSERNRKTAFEIIGEAVRARMTNEVVDQLDNFGQPTGVKMLSPEYRLLKERGIEVLVAAIAGPRFEKHVDDKLFEQWRANWLERAKENARYVEQERSYAHLRGSDMAVANFADSASRLLGHQLTNPEPGQDDPDINQTLEYMVRGTLDQCLRDSELHQRLSKEKQELVTLIEWIRSN